MGRRGIVLLSDAVNGLHWNRFYTYIDLFDAIGDQTIFGRRCDGVTTPVELNTTADNHKGYILEGIGHL